MGFERRTSACTWQCAGKFQCEGEFPLGNMQLGACTWQSAGKFLALGNVQESFWHFQYIFNNPGIALDTVASRLMKKLQVGAIAASWIRVSDGSPPKSKWLASTDSPYYRGRDSPYYRGADSPYYRGP